MSMADGKPWTFVTNHTQVLLTIASNPDIRTRDIAAVVGITERAAQRIVSDLVEAGYIESRRVGGPHHPPHDKAPPQPARSPDRRPPRPPEARLRHAHRRAVRSLNSTSDRSSG